MSEVTTNSLQGVNIYDDNFVNKTGLGCGCDITQTIGMENCKTQILDFELLKKVGGIECDGTQERIKTSITGEDYTKMTQSLNSCLSGKIGFKMVGLSFGRNLNSSLKITKEQLDIYEYGMTMILQKMYALNIKPALYSNLKEFVGLLAWNEINATDKDTSERTDKSKMKSLFKKYGTHVSTKAFYGCLYQYFLYREQNDWESTIDAQLKIGANASIPIPDTGMTVSGDYNASITDTDKECYKHSYKEITERRVGGDVTIEDLNGWLASCKVEKPESCTLLGYALGIGSDSDSGLIPLYELLEDGNVRKEAMKEAMDEYIEENSIKLSTRNMVILDAYAKRFENGNAPEYSYGIDGNKDNRLKYFRLNEEIYDHVKGCTHGEFYFYYALGHLVDDAVVDMKFAHKDDIDGDWMIRGNKANDGVTGSLKNRHLAIRKKNINNDVDQKEFVTGFGIRINGNNNIKAISKGTDTNFHWRENNDSEIWYKGLCHDDVECVYTKEQLEVF